MKKKVDGKGWEELGRRGGEWQAARQQSLRCVLCLKYQKERELRRNVWRNTTSSKVGQKTQLQIQSRKLKGEWALELSLFKLRPTALSLLPSAREGELSAPSPAPCLPVCHHAPHHEENRLKLWNCKPAPIKCFILERLLWWWRLFTAIGHWLRHMMS